MGHRDVVVAGDSEGCRETRREPLEWFGDHDSGRCSLGFDLNGVVQTARGTSRSITDAAYDHV